MGWTRSRWTLVEFGLAWTLMLGMMALAALSEGRVALAQGLATTTVADTIYQADGTGATGTVLISWPAFVTAAGNSVPAGSTSVTIGAGGTLSVTLASNAGATPLGSYYTVVYHLGDGNVTKEYWIVPVSATPVKVSAIRSTVLPLSVAMQTVSKSYVDTAIARALSGSPEDTSPYVLKGGDTMTGPLVLPGDPTAPLQAADKGYVDGQIAGLSGGAGGSVKLLPQATQVVTQPPNTQLDVNNLNGALYASQYANGAGNNGIANAAASADCTNGCDIQVEQTYPVTETVNATALNNSTQVQDHRGGSEQENYFNPNTSGNGINVAHTINLTSTQSAPQVYATEPGGQQFWTGLAINSVGLTGGSNEFPEAIQGVAPYFKTTYTALNLTGKYTTPGQHVLSGSSQNCYGVGDCVMSGLYMTSSGGIRDDADEGAHLFDLIVAEDTSVFGGTCSTGCTTGSTVVQVATTSGPGTQGEGRYMIDKNPAKVLTGGSVISGSAVVGSLPAANFTGTSFPVSVLLQTAQTIPTSAGAIAPGTVTVPISTSSVPAGYQTSTAALPSSSGVACVSDVLTGSGNPSNFETAAYTVVDGSHLSLNLHRPHATGAAVAVGGLCGYGLEQTVDTTAGIRQVFPVIGSTSGTSLFYAGGGTSVVGQNSTTSGFANASAVLTSLVRASGVVTVTEASALPFDINGLNVTVSGAADASYNGTFPVTSTSRTTFTYVQAGANSSTSGGTASYLNGSYMLYPMAEVLGVYNPATKAVDGLMTLAANTVAWAAGDAVEIPHYFQEEVAGDTEFITQYLPRPVRTTQAGISYGGLTGSALNGWVIHNETGASAYFGNGGTHVPPGAALGVTGIWNDSLEAQAGESAVVKVHCNSHGCDRWNSGYDLFQMDTSGGLDEMNYSPATSNLTFNLRGTQYSFTPQAMTAGTLNVTTLNAGSITGALQPSLVASGGYTTAAPSNMARRGDLLGEYLLTEGTGTLAHDTSGHGNDATINGPVWEGTQDLNFTTLGQYVQLPTAINGAKAWQFAFYEAPFGTGAGVQVPQYGDPANYGQNPSILCGTDYSHLCLVAGVGLGKSQQFQAYTTDNTEANEGITAGWHVVTLLCGSNVGGVVTKTRLLYDGAEVGGYLTQGDAGTCGSPTSGNYQVGGSSLLTGTWFLGKVAAVWAWGANLSVSDGMAAAQSGLEYMQSKGVQTKFRPIQHANPLIVGGMDSRTYGVQLSPSTVWLGAMATNDTSYDRLNLGYSGEFMLDGCLMFDLTYGTHIAETSGPTVTMLWGGINDMLYSTQSPRQIANSVRCMVQKAKTAGSRVILATEISAVSNSQPSVDASKDGLDAILRAEAFGWGVDNLADLATDPHLGADGASSNTACFPDNLHPGPACEPYITAIMQNAFNELTGSTETNRNQTAATNYQETAADRFLDLTGTAAQTVTLPDCTGYSLQRQMVNVGSAAATVGPVSGQTLLGSTTVSVGAKALFVPIPGPLATGGCKWERTQ